VQWFITEYQVKVLIQNLILYTNRVVVLIQSLILYTNRVVNVNGAKNNKFYKI